MQEETLKDRFDRCSKSGSIEEGFYGRPIFPEGADLRVELRDGDFEGHRLLQGPSGAIVAP